MTSPSNSQRDAIHQTTQESSKNTFKAKSPPGANDSTHSAGGVSRSQSLATPANESIAPLPKEKPKLGPELNSEQIPEQFPKQGPEQCPEQAGEQTADQWRGLLEFIRRRMGKTLRALFEPEDILQDVLLIAEQDRQTRKRPRPKEEALPWLYGVARHRLLRLSRDMGTRVRPRRDTALPPSMLRGGLDLQALGNSISGSQGGNHSGAARGSDQPRVADAFVSGQSAMPLMGAPGYESHGELERGSEFNGLHNELARETREIAWQSLARMDGESRVNIVMRSLLEVDWETIAFVMDKRGVEGVRKHHARALRALARAHATES